MIEWKVMDCDPEGMFLITSSDPTNPRSDTVLHRDLQNILECVMCELWDAVGHREMKELQACSWACGQDSLLRYILMKLKRSIVSSHQDVFAGFWSLNRDNR